MPLYLDSFKNNQPKRFIKELSIIGLDLFKNSLEKDYFSSVKIHNNQSSNENASLIIDLNCNLSLRETLLHFNKGTWGGFNQLKSSLILELNSLMEINSMNIDIEEFSIFLKDTTIIINRIYEQSIPDQFENILTEIGNHYSHITKREIEIPFEIYVPVFEENLAHTNSTLLNIQSDNNDTKDYFSYWGLYFESEEDAAIYDLKKSTVVYGELYMLNH